MEFKHNSKIWSAEIKVHDEPEGRRRRGLMKNLVELMGQSGAQSEPLS